MSGEKMAILKMLEEGKITADNAAKLLASLEAPGGKESAGSGGRSYGSQTPPSGTRTDGRSWSADFGRKIEVAAKDLEPKIHKFAEVVIEKSVELADAATRSINASRERAAEKERRDTGAGQSAKAAEPRRAGAAPANARGLFEKTLELPVSADLPNEIILKMAKGSVSVKGYNGDKVTLNIAYKLREHGAAPGFLQLGCVYRLDCDPDVCETASAEVFVPFRSFSRVTVETADGNVSLDGINAEKILLNTSGCHISVKNVQAGELKIDNVNGEVLLSNISGGSLLTENANGAVEAVNADFQTLKLETTAEPVSIISQGFYKHSDYVWKISTSNARLKASLPVSRDTGYDLKAYTSLSDVSSGLSGISYIRNDRNCIEGKSEKYDTCAKKVRLELETSNAPLYIN